MATVTEPRTKLLLIEDNPGDARLIQEMIADAGEDSFDVQTADRLETGIQRLATDSFDVVLLDLSLPDSSGLITFLKVRAQASQLPIVVMSGLDDETIADQALHVGAYDYLVKSQVHGEWLVQSLRFAIERNRAEQEKKSRSKPLGRHVFESFSVENAGGVAVVRVTEKILVDRPTIERLGDELFRLVEHEARPKMLLSFSDVRYLSNAAMAKFLALERRIAAARGQLRICNLRPDVYAQLITRRLDQVLDIRDDESSALEDF